MLAIQDAVRSARKDSGASLAGFKLDLPATSERIRMGCGDQIVSLCAAPVGAAAGARSDQFMTKGSF